MNNHLSNDARKETLFKPDDPRLTNEKDTKPYIREHFNNMKLSRSQCIVISIFNYGPYIDNMCTLENFTYNFHRELIRIINPKLSMEISNNFLMLKYR